MLFQDFYITDVIRVTHINNFYNQATCWKCASQYVPLTSAVLFSSYFILVVWAVLSVVCLDKLGRNTLIVVERDWVVLICFICISNVYRISQSSKQDHFHVKQPYKDMYSQAYLVNTDFVCLYLKYCLYV